MILKLKVSFKTLLGRLRLFCEVYRPTPRSWHLTNKFSLRWMIWVKWHKMTSKCSEIESESQIMLNSSLQGMFYSHVRSSTVQLSFYWGTYRLMDYKVIPVVLIMLSHSIRNWSLQHKIALILLGLYISRANKIKQCTSNIPNYTTLIIRILQSFVIVK